MYGRSYRNLFLYDDYGDEYEEDMAQLRRFYGGCFPQSGGSVILNPLDEDDDWDEDDYDDVYSAYDDYEIGNDGEVIFPTFPIASSADDGHDPDATLHPGEYHRSRQDMDDYWNKMSKFNDRGKHKHTKHRGSRGKGNGAKVIDINTPYNANEIGDDGDALESCIIYFYEDYHDKYSRIEFNNLYEFDEYCKEMGFTVPQYVAEQIAYSPISHCCLNPLARERGELEIMRQETYGDLYYEACDVSELSK
jgi:hypothetical protein